MTRRDASITDGDDRLPRWLVVRERNGDAVLGWQLIARNGRVLGRSMLGFEDEGAAQADFAAVAVLADELTVTVEHATPGPGWRWRVDDAAGRTVMRSPRSFERYGSCQRSGRRILESLLSLSLADRCLSSMSGSATAPSEVSETAT